MLLPFNPRFVPLILDGTKKHTIREDKNNLWKGGNIMHMATGVRTKNYNEFMRERCISIQRIKIKSVEKIILVDGRKLSNFEMKVLAVKDGFKSIEDFFDWFNKDFEGKLLHWTELKY